MLNIFPEVKKKLGFGCMRLLMKDGEVDENNFCEMIDAFIENGFNYFDTAHGYIDGKSEKAIKVCLSDRYERDKFLLADKLSDGFFEKQEDIEPFVREQLKICGVEYFEMAHLFSQWGAKYAPKIVICENGMCYNKFGWHTLATCEEYKDFLDQFLPSLTLHLKKLGIHEKTYFHISDEPNASNKDTYQKARNLVSKHLRDFKIIDCFSDFVLYKEGLVKKPIVGIDELQPFFDNNISDLWTYYCCSHTVDVSNRLMSMPSSRNRVIAYQLYKYNIEGFLQWGYNFYYTQFSRNAINPFYVTDAGNAFPAGDAFSVYPGDDKAIESIRLKVFKEALQDISAMRLLEKYISKEKVVELFEAEADMKIEFNKYPRGDNFILNTREKINMLIKEYITK